MSIRKTLASLGIAAALIVPAAPAFAQYPGSSPPTVSPSYTSTPQVKGTKHRRGIALTGADVIGIAAVGAVALGGGFVVRTAARSKRR